MPEEIYASDWLESLVGAAQIAGNHPILVIERFHSFARIADDHLLSVLATMRQLEHDGQLTTIAISPMNYQSIRAILSAQGVFPFVNSAYGDNHDQVVLPPLSRAEFVASAMSSGLESVRANKLFAQSGGPDRVHRELITAALAGETDVIGRAARAIGDGLESFFEIAIGPALQDGDDLRLRVATGRLQPTQAAYIRHLDLAGFLVKQRKGGGLIAVSPVVGRLLLTGKGGPWIAFARVLEAIGNGEYAEAARQAKLLEQDSPNILAFVHLVSMLAAIHDNDAGGLLEIDWKTTRHSGEALLTGNFPIEPQTPWVHQLVRWSKRVQDAVDPHQGGHPRLDMLVKDTADPDVRALVMYSLRAFLNRAKASGSPGEQVRAAASVPESILQSLCAYLGVNPFGAPDELPKLAYQRFFGNHGEYRLPVAGSRLDLTHLLVIVSAILETRFQDFGGKIMLREAQFVLPLHQRLILRIRNSTAHTYSDMDQNDAEYFFGVCETLLSDADAVWSRDVNAALYPDPDRDVLAGLLHGLIAID
ncbi:hypothetical protein NDL68_29315 [Neorhizobium galegae]|nr:hypothetical protein [Neorhizobium galegae]KAA9385705.1 hypothetical protein F4V88_04125 [Neorhizobium galegae]MCM2501941.1 hypothetical protein [Neorhizobium galegae]